MAGGVAAARTGGSVSVAAIDIGASSGRVMVGDVGPQLLALRRVARFANDPVRLPDGLHWDVFELYRQAIHGLRAAVASVGAAGITSAGVDSWGVDYGLLREGTVIGAPFHYRDEGRMAGVSVVHRVIDQADLYDRNGLQFLPFNTIYQLAADRMLTSADQALLIPDLIGYLLTGRSQSERTNASTTGLVDRRTRSWDLELLQRVGLAADLFPPLVDPGAILGPVLPHVGDYVGAAGLPIVAVGSHDTASAVVAVPMAGDDAAYISCGTWGLVGVELESPIATEASRAANFTNEAGVDGRTRFLTNVMGTWILSESLRTWTERGEDVTLEGLLEAAAAVDRPVTTFDVQDPRFLAPGDMPARIVALCGENHLPAPGSGAEMVRSIVESLGTGFADAVQQAESLTGRPIRRVHVVGGGSLNRLLCQAIADWSGRVVIAGPVEATALGNVLVQGRAAGAIGGGLDALRDLVAQTHELVTYRPRAARARSTR